MLSDMSRTGIRALGAALVFAGAVLVWLVRIGALPEGGNHLPMAMFWTLLLLSTTGAVCYGAVMLITGGFAWPRTGWRQAATGVAAIVVLMKGEDVLLTLAAMAILFGIAALIDDDDWYVVAIGGIVAALLLAITYWPR